MDIVYVLGGGTYWQNNEIRFSLRSVQKFCTGYNKIYIIGERPKFVKNIIHIPYPDRSARDPSKNQYEKLIEACKNQDISDDFLFMYDDIIFTWPADVRRLQLFHFGDLKNSWLKCRTGNPYAITLKNTYEALVDRNMQTLRFETHNPVIINKKIFLNVLKPFDWRLPYAYAIKSLYCNMLALPNQRGYNIKIAKPHTKKELTEIIACMQIISICDESLNKDMQEFLFHLLPLPSQFEI